MNDEEVTVTIENSELPTGRLPKEVFGVCLSYRMDTYPDWKKPKPGKTTTAPKRRKKRHYFLSSKRSTQDRLVETFTKYADLDEQTVEVLEGRIEWESLGTVEVQSE